MSAANTAASSSDLRPLASKAWSCDTLLRANSFLVEQQASFGGAMQAQDVLNAARHAHACLIFMCPVNLESQYAYRQLQPRLQGSACPSSMRQRPELTRLRGPRPCLRQGLRQPFRQPLRQPLRPDDSAD